MRVLVLIASLGVAACPAATPNEGSFLETKYVRYVTDQPVTPCGGLARVTDKQVEYLFDLLGEPYAAPLSIEYDWAEDSSALKCDKKVAGCAQATPEGASISSLYLADLHELAHATHLLTIGTSHPVLTEGFATYASNQPGVAIAQDPMIFIQTIEDMFVVGSVAAERYPIAARFVGMTIERKGIDAFKKFWVGVPRNALLSEVRATYEEHFGEPWSDALTALAVQEQAVFYDPYCEGDALDVAEHLELTLTQTCEDDEVSGPLNSAGVVTGVLPIPIQLTSEGMYRFRLGDSDRTGPVTALRGCSNGVAAPTPAISSFVPGDDITQYLGPGRYLLNVRVPLAPDAGHTIEIDIDLIH
jgi:hypothetical protein